MGRRLQAEGMASAKLETRIVCRQGWDQVECLDFILKVVESPWRVLTGSTTSHLNV